METLRMNRDKENQCLFEGKENAVCRKGLSLQTKNHRTTFSTLQDASDGQAQTRPAENKGDKMVQFKSSYAAQGKLVHPHVVVRKNKPQTFQILEDGSSESQSEADKEVVVLYEKNVIAKKVDSRIQDMSVYIEESDSTNDEKDIDISRENKDVAPREAESSAKDMSVDAEEDNLSMSLNSSWKELEELRLSQLSRGVCKSIAPVYMVDNHNCMRKSELLHRPRPDYVKIQPHISEEMRAVLIDWLVPVALSLRMDNETLHLAVSYVDRFLSKMSVSKSKLQLLGVTAILLASKVEEVYVPSVSDLVYLTDNAYTVETVIKMERCMLACFAFDLYMPTAVTFLRLYCHYARLSDTTMCLAMFICELTLMESVPYLKFLPSELAAASIALAQHTLREDVWPRQLEKFSDHALGDLERCIVLLEDTYRNSRDPELPQIRKKYECNKYRNVSLIFPRSTRFFGTRSTDP